MIFADLDYPEHYADRHAELVAALRPHFPELQSGLQGDSWIWVFQGADKVEIDTFYSKKHQVKSARAGPHVERVIEVLRGRCRVIVIQPPALEPHEPA